MNFWSERIVERARLRPHDRFISDPRHSVTSKQYEDETSRLLSVLHKLGLGPSNRVIITLPRGTALAVLSGAMLRGEIAALTLGRYEVASSMDSVCKTLGPHAIIQLAVDAQPTNGFFTSDQVTDEEIRLGSEKVAIRIVQHLGTRRSSPPELAWLLQTSGSTRAPRLVMMDRQNLVERARGEVRDFGLSPQDHLLGFLTFAHDLGLNQFLSALASGSELFIQNQPFIASLAQSLSENIATGITGTPLMWKQLFQQVRDSRPVFTSLRFITVSGGSLPETSFNDLRSLFPNAEILRTYGQTETFRSLLHRGTATHSLGRPLQNVQLKLKADGELIHSGAGQMLGYFGNESATQEKLRADGIHTGDIFRVDENGEYHYIGRKDDMVKRFEYRLHLGEIEETVRLHSDIENVIVLARSAPPGDIRETLLRAYVSLSKSSKITEDDVIKHCKTLLAPNKIPDSVMFVQDFPMTESRKIDRQTLLREWINEDV